MARKPAIPKWIDDDPPQEEIDQNADGSEFIPIPIVEDLLYKVDPYWGTENFKFRIFNIEQFFFASSSVELVINFFGTIRRLVGASTFEISEGENVEAKALSESTKNASKKLGKRFGKNLNGRGDMLVKEMPLPAPKKNGKEKPPAVKLQPDLKIQAQYNHAVENKTGMVDVLEALYEIKYTGEKANVKG